jgi:dynein intermediate chain 2
LQYTASLELTISYRTQEAEAKLRVASEKKDGKDEKMEELLRKVDADFLGMIKEAEDDESRAVEVSPLIDTAAAEEK